uniref:Motile sperm domain containing 2 n=1 Tax=Scleropages formosus TaxID=113540 RepID=A0A8C9QXT6_SCLFO
MASAGISEQDMEKKIEETRQRFQNEYLKDSSDRYDSRDVDRLLRDDLLVDGYLTWRFFVVDDALKMIDESFQWRKEFRVNDLAEGLVPKWTFETGAVYIHGYDKEGNRLFWFNVRKHFKDSKTVRDKKSYVAFWLERHVVQHPDMPITVVFDMSDTSLSNIDLEFVKYIISCFKVYYPKLLCKSSVSRSTTAAWKIVKTWLSPEAINKLKFLSKSEIQSYIDTEQLPSHMGGTDSFKYTYPPLPDEDSHSSIAKNGPCDKVEENGVLDVMWFKHLTELFRKCLAENDVKPFILSRETWTIPLNMWTDVP